MKQVRKKNTGKDFFKKKTRCDKCPLDKAHNDKKKPLERVSKRKVIQYKSDVNDTSNIDILVITDCVEKTYELEKLFNLCKYLGLSNFAIVSAIGCRTKGYELPSPTYSTYTFCDVLDVSKYNPKCVITTGRGIFHFTRSSVFSSWKEFSEFQFNPTYFYPHIDFENWKDRVYPCGFLVDIFQGDTFEYLHFIKQIEFVKKYIKNYNRFKFKFKNYEIKTIESKEEFIQFLEDNKGEQKIGIDTETSGLNVFVDDFECGYVQISFDGVTAYFIPFDVIAPSLFSSWLETKFQIWANGKYDCKVLNRVGITGHRVDEDVTIIYHLLNTCRSSNSLKTLAWFTGFGGYEDDLELYIKHHKIKNYLDIPESLMKKYAGIDAIVTYRLYEFLHKHLVSKQQETYDLYREYILPVIPVFQKIEEEGMLVDKEYLLTYHNHLVETQKEIEEAIYKEANEVFNIASNDELGKTLEKLGLPDYGRTKKGFYKTGIDILKAWKKDGYTISDLLVEYRRIAKLDSSFVGEGIEEEEKTALSFFNTKDKDKGTGVYKYITSDSKVHGTFLPALTDSWRSLSLDPNLQNQPKHGSEGKAFRKIYIAPKDYYICEADYSGFQLRLMGIYSEDKNMIEAFNTGSGDLHSKTGSGVFSDLSFSDFMKVKKESPYKEMRQVAKQVNLAFSFGQSSFSFQKIIEEQWTEEKKDIYIKDNNLKIVVDKKTEKKNKNLTIADDIHKKFFEEYSNLQPYFDKMQSFARENGYVDCPIFKGLRRHIPELLQQGENLSSEQLSHYSTLNNMAINTGAQGGEAIHVYKAIHDIFHEIKNRKLKSRIVGTVHDSVCLIINKDEIKEMYHILKECMENTNYSIPITNEVELSIDKDHPWGFGLEIDENNLEEIIEKYGK